MWYTYIMSPSRAVLLKLIITSLLNSPPLMKSAQWHGWLRHCAMSRIVVSSTSDDIVGIFHLHIASSWQYRTLTEMSTRNISCVDKGGSCIGLITLPIVSRCGTMLPAGAVHQPAASSVHRTISCKHSLVLLRMGEIITRNTLSWLKLSINRYCCI